jgi:hypothetical protein
MACFSHERRHPITIAASLWCCVAAASFIPPSASAQFCRGNPNIGCTNAGAKCSDGDVLIGQCKTNAAPPRERECVCVGHQQPAGSFDYKIHPGSLCQPNRGDEAVNFNRIAGFIMHNKPGATLTVTCPIIRDRVPHRGRTDELTRIDAGMHFSIGFGQETMITCKWIGLNENGQEIASIDPNTKSISPLGTLSMFWDVKPSDTAIDGSYSIDCQIPAGAALLRYVIGEDGSTDDGGF